MNLAKGEEKMWCNADNVALIVKEISAIKEEPGLCLVREGRLRGKPLFSRVPGYCSGAHLAVKLLREKTEPPEDLLEHGCSKGYTTEELS